MRKLLSLLLILALALGLSSALAAAETTTEEPVSFEGPYILTSAGQSADFQMVKAMLKLNKVENSTDNALLTPDTIPEGTGTIIIVIGGSSKGLGAAGIDAEQELERVDSVIKHAEEKGIAILAMHIGGTARRGELSDKFIEPVVAAAKACIVVEEANANDMLFTALSEKYSLPLTLIEKKSDGAAALKDILH